MPRFFKRSRQTDDSSFWRYGTAVTSVVVLVIVSLAIDSVLRSPYVPLVLLIAVVLAAHIGGRGPALLASALSVLSIWYFFLEPRFSLAISNPADVGILVAFAIVTGVISLSDFHSRKGEATSLRRTVLLGGAFITTILLTWLLYADFARERDRQHWVEHSYQVLNAIQGVLSNLQDAETGQRGYLLTGEDSYLQPYEAAFREEQLARQTLRHLTADNAVQQTHLDALDRLVKAKFDVIQRTISLRRGGNPDAALAVVKTHEGKRIMDQCRAVLHDMREEDRRLLAVRTRAAEAQAMRTRWVLGLGSGSLMLLLFIAALVIERDSREREQTSRALRDSEEQFRTLANNIPQLCWMANADGWIFWYNQRWYEYTGTTPEQMQGWGWQSVHDPEMLPTVLDSWKSSIASGAPFDKVFPLRGADGGFRPFLTQVVPVRNEAGEVVRWFGTNTDISEQQRIEQMLRERAQLLDLSYDAILARNAQDLISYWNAGAVEVYGYTREEALGRGSCELLRTEFPQPLSSILDTLRRDGRWTGELVQTRKDGIKITVASRWAADRNPQGDIEAILKTDSDITERKRSEEALRQSLERLERVMEIETVGVMFWDLNTGCMVDANDTFLKLMGYSRSQVEARELTWQNLTPPEYMDVSRAEVEKFLATGRVGPYEKEYFRNDGTRRWLLFAGSSLGNNQCVEFCVDISDRKKAEQALRESENRFRTLIEQASDAFFLHDGDGRFLEVNRQACESLGYTREELLGMQVCDVEQEIGVHTAKQAWEQAEPGKAYTLQGRQRRKDGTVFPVEARLSASYIGGQKLHLGLVRDVTERKLAEERIQQLNAELEDRVRQRTAQLVAANKELEAFSYSVSHDLRAPLRGIDGWSLALFEDYGGQLDSRATKYLQRVRSETQRMGELIDDLLELSRITRADVQTTAIDLSTLANAVAGRLCDSSTDRKIEFVIHPGLTTIADPRLLDVVLVNLFSNAVKFTGRREDARIEFGQADAGGEKMFYVKDNESVSTCPTPVRCSAPFNVSTKPPNSQVPASGWLLFSALSIDTAGVSGQRHNRTKGRRSISL
jgi:PAS domain S-box-containing protein